MGSKHQDWDSGYIKWCNIFAGVERPAKYRVDFLLIIPDCVKYLPNSKNFLLLTFAPHTYKHITILVWFFSSLTGTSSTFPGWHMACFSQKRAKRAKTAPIREQKFWLSHRSDLLLYLPLGPLPSTIWIIYTKKCGDITSTAAPCNTFQTYGHCRVYFYSVVSLILHDFHYFSQKRGETHLKSHTPRARDLKTSVIGPFFILGSKYVILSGDAIVLSPPENQKSFLLAHFLHLSNYLSSN